MEIYLEHGISSPKKTVQVSVPLIADRSEIDNVQVKATVKDVGLDELQVGSSQGLGVFGPETIHVGTDVVPENMHDGGSDGQRDVGPDNVAAGGSEGVRDVGPNTVAAAGNEGVTDSGPNTVRDVGPKIVADASSEEVRDAGAQNMEYDEVEPDIMQNLLNTEETIAGCESSDDSLRGVHFEDSEEERALGAGDGFMHPEVGQAEAELNDKIHIFDSGSNGFVFESLEWFVASNVRAGSQKPAAKSTCIGNEHVAVEVENCAMMEEVGNSGDV
ncbi:hypothetical protein SESBI_25345 [Sesbania bispinosa]|nr:hypothetical protein SESBI_25345 [Sesbania bispinosa]